jgi:hypothetical protein
VRILKSPYLSDDFDIESFIKCIRVLSLKILDDLADCRLLEKMRTLKMRTPKYLKSLNWLKFLMNARLVNLGHLELIDCEELDDNTLMLPKNAVFISSLKGLQIYGKHKVTDKCMLNLFNQAKLGKQFDSLKFFPKKIN